MKLHDVVISTDLRNCGVGSTDMNFSRSYRILQNAKLLMKARNKEDNESVKPQQTKKRVNRMLTFDQVTQFIFL